MKKSACAFLLYSGTVCVHFYYVQALSVCISIISPTVFQHFLRAFPLLREAFWIASGLLNVLGSFLDRFRLLFGFCAALDCF